MSEDLHRYTVRVTWTGNDGVGTSSYRSYRRDHQISHEWNSSIAGSSDPVFRGDPNRWNPEQLLVASLSQCHMLWFLHLAAEAGVIVVAYEDNPVGEMKLNPDGSGQFTVVTLRPSVTVEAEDMTSAAQDLHSAANRMCFIAQSVGFPVTHEPETTYSGERS